MKKLIPPFLKQIDNYLLLNHPTVWISKIHYVLFYGIIMSLLSALAGFGIPVNVTQPQDLGLWYFLFTILAIVALCFWLYQNIIFNIEKKFGKRHWFDEYKVFFLNFCCVLIFISFPIAFTSIYNSRVANTVSDEELINDINTLNIAEPFLFNNTSNYSTYYDSVKQETFYNLNDCIVFDSYTPWELKNDTIEKNILSNYELLKIYENSKKNNTIKTAITNYVEVVNKYGYYKDFSHLSDTLFNRYTYLKSLDSISNSAIYNHYNIVSNYDMESAFRNISDAKFQPIFIYRFEFLNFLLFTCFYVSLVLMVFKMVPWKQFLLTLLAFVIIPIILFIISQLMPYSWYGGRDNFFITMLVLLFITALVFTLLSLRKGKPFNAFQNICTQIVYYVMPLFPFCLLGIIKELFFDSYSPSYNQDMQTAISASLVDGAQPQANVTAYKVTVSEVYAQLEHEYWEHLFDQLFVITLYGGLILFILMIMPAMKQLFVKQLALPRKS